MLLVTEIQLADFLKISPRTLQTQRQLGKGFPFVKIGKSVRYDLNIVKEFIKNNNFKSTSQSEPIEPCNSS